MRRRPTARTQLTTLSAVALLCYQLLAPLSAVAAPAASDAASTVPAAAPGIAKLGYDPNWVTPAQPAPISLLDGASGTASGDPSIGGPPSLASSRPPAVPTEVPALRGEYSRTLANPNGSFSQEISQTRVNYPDKSGSWQPLDLSLVNDLSGAYSLKVAASDRTVRFGTTDASAGLAQLSAEGYAINLRAIGYGAGQTLQSTAVGFAGSGNNGALGIAPTDTGFEFSVTLDNAGQSNVYQFALDSGDLIASLAADGQTILLRQPAKAGVVAGLEGGTGNEMGRISAPGLLEGDDSWVNHTAVKVQLTSAGSSGYLITYTIDPTWLHDPGRKFPVILDPTTCIGVGQSGCSSGNDDEFIFSYHPDSHTSGWTVVRIGYDNNSGDNFPGNATYAITRGLFYFPDVALNSPTGDAVVTAADLAITINADQTDYGNTAVGKSYYAYPVNTPWGTNSVTWNDIVPNGFDTTPVSPAVVVPSSPNGKVLTFDIKDLARRWYTRRGSDWHTDEGVLIKSGLASHTEVLADGELYIYKYNYATASKRPKLTITYDLPKVQINFDPALGNTYAPSTMLANQVTNLPIQVLNNGSSFDFDTTNWKIGWRWLDANGSVVSCPGTCIASLPATVSSGNWSSVFNIGVTAPAAGQYTLRLDLVRVVSGTNLYASDWALPSAYYSRNKKILTTDSTRWTGTSAIERDEFGISVTNGAGGSGASPSVGDLAINPASGNLRVAGDTGLGFRDLISPSLTYGYDSANASSSTGGILGANGWFTNLDERFTTADGGNTFTYQDPAGNRYLVDNTADAQYSSGAPFLIDRRRITAWDESNPGGWAAGTLPTVSTTYAYSGTHSLSIPASETGTETNLASQVDLLHYPSLNLWVKSSGTDKAAIGFRILDHDNPASVNWFFYTFGGTSWTVSGFSSKWINTGSALTSAGGYWLAQSNLWADARAAISSLGKNLYFASVDLRGSSGATGSLYYDAAAFVGTSAVNFDDAQPGWSTGTAGFASLNTADKTTGTASIQVSPAGNPDCVPGCKSTDLLQYPFMAWDWKKVGGSSIGQVFHFSDPRDPTHKFGDITYYAGPVAPPGATNPVQVSPTPPTDWTHVQRNLLEDARQILGFYNDNPLGTDPAAPPSAPVPDPVTLTGFALIAADGSYALFDYEQQRSSSGLGSATAVADDDWTVTYPDRSQHLFNLDGLLERIVDRDANTLDLVWTYDFASSGPAAYTLTTIRAPGDGLSLSAGSAQREIAVSTSSPSGFKQTTFTEQLGSTTSYTGRRADFYVATTTGTTWGIGDLVKVSPARNNSATCGSTRPNGCREFAYTDTSNHLIDLEADPRWDGSTSGANDMRLDVTYDGSNRAYQILDHANASAARLYVEAFDTGTGGSYRRVLYQDAANRAASYASYLDLSPDGQPLITYVPKACVGTCSTTSTTWPAAPGSGDRLTASSYNGLAHLSQTTSYRIGGGSPQLEVQRQASNAGAKVDNLIDPLAAAQLAWTQTSDQYYASLADSGGSNPDLYRTEYAYNAASQPIAVSSPVANAHPDYAGTVKSTSGLSAYWRLGETSGSTAADSSGNGNTATISATGVTLNQPDALTNDANPAMLLNGSSGRLTSSLALPQSAYTLEAWVNQQTDYAGDANGKGILGRWNSNSGALLYTAANKLVFVHGGIYVQPGIALTPGRWYHVAATWDGAVARVFIDGKQVGAGSVTSAPGTGASSFELGSYANGASSHWDNALLDEVAVYSQALEPHRIQSHYLAGRSMALPTQRTTYDAEGHPTEAATHFVLNGGFESGLAEWETGSGAAITTTTVKSGLVALNITTSAYARQDAQLVPGQTVRFQFAAKTDGGGSTHATYTASYWQVSSQSWVNLVSASHTTSTWTSYAFDLTVPADSDGRVRVQFSNNAASGTAYFDDALLVSDWSQAAYAASGLLTDTFGLQSGNSSGATLRTNLGYAAGSTAPAIFPTSRTANYVDGVYNDASRDEDLITTQAFDAWGRVLTSTDPDGVTTTSTYAANLTDLATAADGLGNTTAYTYDVVGQPLTVTSPAGLVTSTTYDLWGNPLTVTAPDGVVSQNTYNAYGQRTASYANYLDGTPSGASGVDDVKTAYTYDPSGRQLTSVADTGYSGSPDATTTLTYDQLGNVLTSAQSGTGVSARTTTNYFATTTVGGTLYSRSTATGVGLPIAPAGSPAPLCPGTASTYCNTVTSLDLNGRAVRTTDAYGKASVVDYDLAGHAVRSIANYVDGVYSGGSPDTDVASSATYDIVGRLASTTSCGVTCSGGDLRVTTTTYDRVDRTIQVMAQMPAGTDYAFRKTVYLPSGRIDRTSAPAAAGTADSALNWTKTEYDAAGRAVRTLAHYDIAGNAHFRLDAFEDGNLTGWSSAASGYFTTAAAGSLGLDDNYHPTAPNTGAGRLHLTTHASSTFNGTWWDLSGQTFQSGRTYHLHADLLAASGSTLQAFLGVDSSGASYGSSGAISTTGAWQSVDITWSPSSSVSANVHFALRKDTAGAISAYLDNVQVYDTSQPDWNTPSETGYNPDSQAIASVLPPGHAGEEPLVTTTAYDPAGRAVAVSVNAQTTYSHQLMADGASNGLVAYFPLDERSGTTATDVKGALNATYAGGYRLGQAGGVDESRTGLGVDGVSGTASRSANVTSATDNFSLEAWFRRDTAGSSQVIVHNGTASSGWGLGLDGSGNLAARYETTGWLSTAVSPSVGVWHYAVLVRNAGTTTVYLDGTAYTPSSSTTAPSTPGAGFSIGREAASTRFFGGAIDEVALYTSALSAAVVSAHYAAGRPTSTDTRLTSRSAYDPLGRATDQISPRGILTRSTYDRLGRTTATTANYIDGSPSSGSGADDLTATFAYDALGEQLGSCSAAQVYAGGCDPATPSNGQAWHSTYDAMGHQLSQTPPLNVTLTALSSTGWTYDAGGRLTSTCDYAAGGSCASATRHTDSTYDGLGRELTRIVYAGSGTGTPKLSWTTTWNPDGSQASLAFDGSASAEGTDTLTFTYDGLGRADQVKRGATVLTDNGWNPDGSLASRIDGTAGSSSFGYDWATRLTSLSSPLYTGTQTFAWRLDGLLDGRQWPVGASGAATVSYDGAKRPTAFAKIGSAAASFSQTYDRAGNVTSEGRSLTGITGPAGGGTQTFSYDGLNRVSGAALASGTTDATVPSVPAGLSATAVAADRVDLAWTASSDNGGVMRYRIYRGGTQISEVAGSATAFSDRSTAASTAYSYTVAAVDAAGNASAQSGAANATTPAAGGGTITHVQDAGNQISTAANSFSVTLPANPTAGNALLLSVGINSSTTTSTVSSPGATWSLVIRKAGTGTTTETWAALNVTGGTGLNSILITFAASATAKGAAQVSEFANVASTSATDVTGSATGGSTTAVSSGSATSTNASDLIYASVGWRTGAAPTTSPSAPWTNLPDQVNANISASAAWQVVSSTGAYSAAWTLGASTPGYDGTLVALKAGAGGGADTTAPSVPAGLVVNPASDTAVALAWSPSSDNVAVQGYRVYRAGSLIATTASLSYLDPGLSASTAYSYTLAAIDGAGNASAQSSSVGTTTLASGSGTAFAYAYDRDANRTTASQAGLSSTASYDRSGELISRTDAGTSTYLAYDAYGNQTSAAPAVNQNTASAYDLADRLVSLTPPGQTATSFSYDALGRVLSRVTPAGTDAYEYVGTTTTVWRSTRGGVATSSAIDPSGARLATVQSGTTGYLLADLHGNLAAVVNSGETALLSATRYDSFGQTVAAADSGASFPTPWRFQGRLDLSPDNHPLYAFGARNYDPGSGAFTSLDSYAGSPADPSSLNRYAYAEANPWTLVDPDGHMAETCGGQCGGFASDAQAQAFANLMAQRAAQAQQEATQRAMSVLHANDPMATAPINYLNYFLNELNPLSHPVSTAADTGSAAAESSAKYAGESIIRAGEERAAGYRSLADAAGDPFTGIWRNAQAWLVENGSKLGGGALKVAGHALSVLGIGVGFVAAAQDQVAEDANRHDLTKTERSIRVGIHAALNEFGGLAGGGAGLACAPFGPVAIGCAVGGAWLGSALGSTASEWIITEQADPIRRIANWWDSWH